MNGSSTGRPWLELDQFVEAFDVAWAEGGPPAISDFLPPPADPHFDDVLVELIRVDMEWRWQHGCGTSLEEYRRAYPVVLNDADALERVAFEEFRCRRQAGEPVQADEYARKYDIQTSKWSIIYDGNGACQPPAAASAEQESRLNGHAPTVASEFPEPGADVLGFRLLSELGRGAFSRVYLARQGDLANRLVVLKLSTESFAEADKLAQLQHANIVSIYSVHRAGGFSVVCMPYFGAATLADVLETVVGKGTLPDSGRAISDTLTVCKSRTRRTADETTMDGSNRAAGGGASVASLPWVKERAVPGPITLAELSYVEAVFSIGSRLAAGLAHAHERGILHRDLKPANVLIADDGRPMLLDFNLSHDIKRPNGDDRPMIGGTLPYMAPEQIRAFHQRTNGGDERSDIYSLGAILYELLAGKSPFPARKGPLALVLPAMLEDRLAAPRSLRRHDRTISAAVSAIIGRCIEANPDRRYPTAIALKEDLDRQLANLPLRHVREPSLCESAGKWVRRHPRMTSGSAVAMMAAVVLLAVGLLVAARSQRLNVLEASAAYQRFHDSMRQAQIASLDAATQAPGVSDDALVACRRALTEFGVLDNPNWRQSTRFRCLPAATQESLVADSGELLFLMATLMRADAALAEADSDQRHARLREARAFNVLAQTCFSTSGPPAALLRQQRVIAAELGGSQPPASVPVLVTAKMSSRDHGMLACQYSLQRRFREALGHWKQTVAQDPQNIWSLYGLGFCHDQLSQSTQAIACYAACIALKPDFVDAYSRRGLAYLKQEEFELAGADFDDAARLQPNRKEVLVNRALTRFGQERDNEAIADLEAAIKLHSDDPRTHLMLSRVRQRSGDLQGAKRSRQRSLELEPADDLACVARGAAQLALDPAAALVEFDRALKLNPLCLAALESKAHVFSEKLGRVEDAIGVLDRAIGLYPEQASIVAARGVLLARLYRREAALADAERALALDSSGALAYQVAGIYALLSTKTTDDRRRAYALLVSAFRLGYGEQLVEADPDLDPVRDDPQFQKLIHAAHTLYADSP
jgi:eukaryotic-like serine/threonine-protein kinase